jgi:hypothetical protein
MIDECGQILETLKGHAAELLQITDLRPNDPTLCEEQRL